MPATERPKLRDEDHDHLLPVDETRGYDQGEPCAEQSELRTSPGANIPPRPPSIIEEGVIAVDTVERAASNPHVIRTQSSQNKEAIKC